MSVQCERGGCTATLGERACAADGGAPLTSGWVEEPARLGENAQPRVGAQRSEQSCGPYKSTRSLYKLQKRNDCLKSKTTDKHGSWDVVLKEELGAAQARTASSSRPHPPGWHVTVRLLCEPTARLQTTNSVSEGRQESLADMLGRLPGGGA